MPLFESKAIDVSHVEKSKIARSLTHSTEYGFRTCGKVGTVLLLGTQNLEEYVEPLWVKKVLHCLISSICRELIVRKLQVLKSLFFAVVKNTSILLQIY